MTVRQIAYHVTMRSSEGAFNYLSHTLLWFARMDPQVAELILSLRRFFPEAAGEMLERIRLMENPSASQQLKIIETVLEDLVFDNCSLALRLAEMPDKFDASKLAFVVQDQAWELANKGEQLRVIHDFRQVIGEYINGLRREFDRNPYEGGPRR